MLFNSLSFLIFFPVVITLYFLTPQKWRWLLLLAASYFFYMSWRPAYIFLILISTGIDYFAGRRMGQLSEKRDRRKYLILSLVVNLGLLAVFKYFNFFNDSIQTVLNSAGIGWYIPQFELLLPVGISFYTFQTLSYSIDVYRGTTKPEKHLGIFALYVAFWPQLVAGPIERSSQLLPQFRRHVDFDYDRVRGGLLRMLWGFFMKLVIADRLAVYVNAVYNHPHEYSGLPIVVATFFFAFQIYCDFAGYTNIAIGSAKVMGFDLMENFKRPYFSQSIPEFWHRWHISLSTWFRDYVYIPMGGSRVSRGRYYFNLMVTFVLSGLWHGANWTFVIWGALHGFFMIITVSWRDLRKRSGRNSAKRSPLLTFASIIGTFLVVSFAWVFFRAATVSEAVLLLQQIFAGGGDLRSLIFLQNPIDFALAVLLIGVLLIQEAIVKDLQIDQLLTRQPAWMRWTFYVAVLLAILWLGVFTQNDFIYFQF